jgi:H+/Cl- antiporter ClcA
MNLASISGSDIPGPGNVVAQRLLHGNLSGTSTAFPITKLLGTLFTYWSGIAGCIFAPCLSIGAALGADTAHWLEYSVAGFALLNHRIASCIKSKDEQSTALL